MAKKKPVDGSGNEQKSIEAPDKEPVLYGFCPRCGADSDYPRFDTQHKDGCSGRPL